MCSIAGAFFTRDPENFDTCLSTVKKIIDLTSHRGPDAQALWSDQEARIILGHARLAIVDCNPRSNQPFVSGNGSKILVFNGEIYNYKELKTSLESLGYVFETISDTEVLLYALDAWGLEDSLERLDGIFAFALFDLKTKTLSVARDRFGVKPFFFACSPEGFYFSSSARALLNWPSVKSELSAQGIWHYFTLMAFPAPFTAFENVFALPAGYCASINQDGKVTFKRWYKLEEKILSATCNTQKISFDSAVQTTQELLGGAVAKRVVSEVKSGLFLSGGLDSSLIAALASLSRQSFFSQKIYSFNLSFEFDPENSERVWAERVAKKFGLEHRSIVVGQKEFARAYEQMLECLDSPVSDPVNIPFLILSQVAQAQGIRVVFVGEGADELFGGYDWYFKLARLEPILKRFIPKSISKYLGAACKFLGRNFMAQIFARHSLGQELFWTSANLFDQVDKAAISGRKPFSKEGLPGLLHKHGIGREMESLFTGKFEPNSVVSKICPELEQALDTAQLVKYFAKPLKQVMPAADSFLMYSYIDFQLRIPNLLMSRVDQMSMAYGLEVREPFLDTKLVEFVLGLPALVRLQGLEKKLLLKAILQKYFEPEFLNRRKIGFKTPIEKLF